MNTWRESPFYSEPERAALELTEVVTISIGLLQARKSAHGILRLRRFPLKGALIEQQISYFNVINLNVVVVNEVICSTNKDR